MNNKAKKYYDKGVLVNFKEGDSALFSTTLAQEVDEGDGHYTFKEGDTLEAIAGIKYNDSKQWYRIAQANGIFNPFNIEAGTVLRIPTLKDVQT